mgnify:CR=1 FL=1
MKKNKSNIQESIFVIFFGIIIISIFSFWIYNYFTEDLIPNLNYSNSPEDNYIFNENNLGFPIDEFYQGGADVFLNDPEALFLIDAHVLNFTYDNETKIKKVLLEFESQEFEVIITPDKKVPYINEGQSYKFAGYNQVNDNNKIDHIIEKVFIR